MSFIRVTEEALREAVEREMNKVWNDPTLNQKFLGMLISDVIAELTELAVRRAVASLRP